MIDTKTARIHLSDEGAVIVRIRDGAFQSRDDATIFGRMRGNIYLRIARPGIPTQLFMDETRAVEWLKKHRG